MKKRFVLTTAFLLVFSLLNVYAQSNAAFHIGSAKAFRGNTVIATVFVSDRSTSWSRTETDTMTGYMREGMTWLINEARRYNTTISFTEHWLNNNQELKLDRMPATGSGRRAEIAENISEVILNRLGYRRPLDLYNELIAGPGVDHVVLMLILKTNIDSCFAFPFSHGDCRDTGYLETIVQIVPNMRDAAEFRGVCFAHEILHLFGAEDFYQGGRVTRRINQTLRQMFPRSIMHEICDDFSRYEVDHYTAWIIGWHNEPRPEYATLHPEVAATLRNAQTR